MNRVRFGVPGQDGGGDPAMSSWTALRRRIDFEPGRSALARAATGNAGRPAVQVARRLGAAHAFAAGRHADRPAALSAARLQIVGNGQGLAPTRDILAELPAPAEEIGRRGQVGPAERPPRSRPWRERSGSKTGRAPWPTSKRRGRTPGPHNVW
jgi:hypothetical protein